MDNLFVGRSQGASGSGPKSDFSDIDPTLFGKALAKELDIPSAIPSLGAVAKPLASVPVEPKPTIFSAPFSDKEMTSMYASLDKFF